MCVSTLFPPSIICHTCYFAQRLVFHGLHLRFLSLLRSRPLYLTAAKTVCPLDSLTSLNQNGMDCLPDSCSLRDCLAIFSYSSWFSVSSAKLDDFLLHLSLIPNVDQVLLMVILSLCCFVSLSALHPSLSTVTFAFPVYLSNHLLYELLSSHLTFSPNCLLICFQEAFILPSCLLRFQIHSLLRKTHRFLGKAVEVGSCHYSSFIHYL